MPEVVRIVDSDIYGHSSNKDWKQKAQIFSLWRGESLSCWKGGVQPPGSVDCSKLQYDLAIPLWY